jgi:hypothetical protein
MPFAVLKMQTAPRDFGSICLTDAWDQAARAKLGSRLERYTPNPRERICEAVHEYVPVRLAHIGMCGRGGGWSRRCDS